MAKKSAASKSRPAAPRSAKAAAPKVRREVSIDYPVEGEAVRPGHYSIRLTAPAAAQAQIRLDGGEWKPCRDAVGHFWYDWSPVGGPALIEARARAGAGRWTAAPARRCVVES